MVGRSHYTGEIFKENEKTIWVYIGSPSKYKIIKRHKIKHSAKILG